MYKLKIAKKADKFLHTLPAKELLKVMIVIEKLKENPRPRWIEKLKGIKKGEYDRTSWGNYHIIYVIGRDDSYKKLNKRLR